MHKIGITVLCIYRFVCEQRRFGMPHGKLLSRRISRYNEFFGHKVEKAENPNEILPLSPVLFHDSYQPILLLVKIFSKIP